MLKKDKLLKHIEAIINSKKRLIPLLNKHISSSLFFSDLKPEQRKKIIDDLQNIVIIQIKHQELIKGIKEEITKGKNDVY